MKAVLQSPPFAAASGYGFDSRRFFPQPLMMNPSPSLAEDSYVDDENQLPTPAEFDAIVDDYLNNLSPKKRDKALVDQQRYQLIHQVLKDPRNTAISTAQFRFWVKKMFQLQPGTIDLVCHDNKPVAMKEQIYSILVKAHREAQHGGRDKTSALVRRKFSWIPKELVARFVRHCPFCITRRNGGQSPTTTSSVFSHHHHQQQQQRYPRHSFDASSLLCTPSMQEDHSSDLSSSGPPSAESAYAASPYNDASSPSRRGSSIYDRDEEDLLRSYHHHYGSLESSAPQSPMYYHHAPPSTTPTSTTTASTTAATAAASAAAAAAAGYLGGYSSYYYSNVLGIAPCESNHHQLLRGDSTDILGHQSQNQAMAFHSVSSPFLGYGNDDTNNSLLSYD